VFGTLTAPPSRTAQNAEHPELSDINYDPDNGNLVEVGGTQVGNFLPWPSDLVYFREINRGGILRALQPPGEGG
jgi:taurine dioxygenase